MRTAAAVTLALLPAALASGQEAPVRLRVRNALDAARPSETVEVTVAALAGRVEAADLARLAVTDGRSGHEVLSQAVDEDGDGAFDRLVFQADFAPGEAREFRLERAEARKARRDEYRVYGALRARAPGRLRVGERQGRLPHLRPGPGDVREGAAHEQHGRRVEQAHPAPGPERLVPASTTTTTTTARGATSTPREDRAAAAAAA